MKYTVAKQFVFDCAVELLHGSEGLSNKQIANKLLHVVQELDKKPNVMWVVSVYDSLDYENSVCGVFSSEERAKAYAEGIENDKSRNNEHDFATPTITQWSVDVEE